MRFWRRLHNQDGVTLIELLATLVITVMIGAVVLSILWISANRATSLVTYSTAQRQLLTVNHALTKELQSADYVQVQTQGTASGRQVILWLYRGGFVQNPNMQPAWLYNTTTVQATPSTNDTSATAVVGAKCFGAFVFTQQADLTWNVLYTNQVPVTTGSACPSTMDANALRASSVLTQNGIQVAWDFPNLYGDSASAPTQAVDCKFVNSFIIRLSTTYRTPTGKNLTYYLTAGYHDKDVR